MFVNRHELKHFILVQQIISNIQNKIAAVISTWDPIIAVIKRNNILNENVSMLRGIDDQIEPAKVQRRVNILLITIDGK